MEQIKPCPFCNGNPYTRIMTYSEMTILTIGCRECDLVLRETVLPGIDFDVFDETKNKLIGKWNRRADNGKEDIQK